MSQLRFAAGQALEQLRHHRLRTGLAVTAVAIGVAAAVGAVALRVSLVESVRARFNRIGGTSVYLARGAAGKTIGGRYVLFPRVLSPSLEDASRLKAAWPAIGWITPQLSKSLPVRSTRVQLAGVVVNAVLPDFQNILNYRVTAGHFFGEEEVRDHARVAMLKASLAQDLFGADSAVGREIRVGDLRMLVVGVIAPRASWDDFRQVYIPLTTGTVELGIPARNCRLWLKLREEIAPADAMPVIADLLSKLHPGSKPEAFFVLSFGKFQQSVLASVEKLARSLLGIALLTLLTGGAGVMNVLLISASERTREIGLKKALGARRRDIGVQMLLEAALLCAAGGTAGLAGSAGVAKAATEILRKGAEPGFVTPLPFHVTFSMGLVSLLCVAAVTMTFGAFPAWRAAHLEPAEALRRE